MGIIYWCKFDSARGWFLNKEIREERWFKLELLSGSMERGMSKGRLKFYINWELKILSKNIEEMGWCKETNFFSERS